MEAAGIGEFLLDPERREHLLLDCAEGNLPCRITVGTETRPQEFRTRFVQVGQTVSHPRGGLLKLRRKLVERHLLVEDPRPVKGDQYLENDRDIRVDLTYQGDLYRFFSRSQSREDFGQGDDQRLVLRITYPVDLHRVQHRQFFRVSPPLRRPIRLELWRITGREDMVAADAMVTPGLSEEALDQLLNNTPDKLDEKHRRALLVGAPDGTVRKHGEAVARAEAKLFTVRDLSAEQAEAIAEGDDILVPVLEGESYEGAMLNTSIGGMALRLAVPEGGVNLIDDDRVYIVFRLPHYRRALTLKAAVRSRRTVEEGDEVGLILGVEFDREGTPGVYQQVLLNYIMERQRELLRKRRGEDD